MIHKTLVVTLINTITHTDGTIDNIMMLLLVTIGTSVTALLVVMVMIESVVDGSGCVVEVMWW